MPRSARSVCVADVVSTTNVVKRRVRNALLNRETSCAQSFHSHPNSKAVFDHSPLWPNLPFTVGCGPVGSSSLPSQSGVTFGVPAGGGSLFSSR
eukprot:s121_g3.t1